MLLYEAPCLQWLVYYRWYALANVQSGNVYAQTILLLNVEQCASQRTLPIIYGLLLCYTPVLTDRIFSTYCLHPESHSVVCC